MECDIAMLTVDDEEFWGQLEPVTFDGLPALQDQVTVVGFPIGGDTMSVSSGVVSRIEVTSYVHGASELLGIQIDAAVWFRYTLRHQWTRFCRCIVMLALNVSWFYCIRQIFLGWEYPRKHFIHRLHQKKQNSTCTCTHRYFLLVLTFQHPKLVQDVYLPLRSIVIQPLLRAVILHSLRCNAQMHTHHKTSTSQQMHSTTCAIIRRACTHTVGMTSLALAVWCKRITGSFVHARTCCLKIHSTPKTCPHTHTSDL